MQRARTGRRAPGHLGEITLRPWVMFLRLVLCIFKMKASCMCACPIPQAPPALPSLCRSCFQQACAGQHAPVYPRDVSPGPWAPPPHCLTTCCLGRVMAAPSNSQHLITNGTPTQWSRWETKLATQLRSRSSKCCV